MGKSSFRIYRNTSFASSSDLHGNGSKRAKMAMKRDGQSISLRTRVHLIWSDDDNTSLLYYIKSISFFFVFTFSIAVVLPRIEIVKVPN